MALYGPSAYGDGTESVTNQFAAMPSLHVAWSLFIGVALVTLLTSRWRWLALAHPVLTTAVVVGTGNHYWLDAAAAGALVLLAMLVHGLRPAVDGPVSCPPTAPQHWPPAEAHHRPGYDVPPSSSAPVGPARV